VTVVRVVAAEQAKAFAGTSLGSAFAVADDPHLYTAGPRTGCVIAMNSTESDGLDWTLWRV